MEYKYVLILVVATLFAALQAEAQEVSVALGPNEIGVNEQFTITVKIQDDRLRRYDDFPEIPGFEKAGISTSSSTNIVNGQVSSSQSVTQTYLPTREGTFKLSPFRMNVNDTQVSSSGTSITVGPASQNSRGNNPFDFNDPFDNFFERDNKSQEFVDVKDDAFLALSTDKDTVYLGEGFTTTLAFYVSEKNQAPLQFYDLGKQLTDILKKIRPSNAWEENFNIENINGKPVSIGGENYTQYKIYQATFYPLNRDAITFPEVGLQMIKYRVAKNPSFFGRRRQEDFKTFYSQPKKVFVKALPSHPLMESVAVGDYRLEEEISDRELTTGNSFNYTFKIVGEGNISAIEKPDIRNGDNFDVYAPSIEQNISRRNNRVAGSKAFSYYAVPNEPGEYQLGNYFNWVFFNTSTERYDTLRSEIAIKVSGKSRKNDYISSQDVGTFYDAASRADNRLRSLDNDGWLQLLANMLILGMLVLTVVIVFKK
ncbi:BatD family protein [Catalinimonas sp. 4WD22]|uniref:BatD family protein n=1 Tax=Catalinimonas locisalis TaxID=3133978 RepID=UPI003100DF5A